MASVCRRFFRSWIPPVALFIFVWYGVGLFLREIRGAPFPLPGETACGMLRMLAERELLLNHTIFAHVAASFQRWLGGYVIGVGGGLGIGLLITLFPAAGAAVMPLVSLVHLVPGLAWIPVAILAAGIGNSTAIMLIALTAFPPVAISLANGIQAVPGEFIMVSLMCGDGRWRRFFRVQLPAALPHLVTGLRLALANSWRVVVAAEMVIGTGLGLGYSIIQSRWTLDYVSAFICIGFIVAMGLLVDRGLFGLIERLTLWKWGMKNDE